VAFAAESAAPIATGRLLLEPLWPAPAAELAPVLADPALYVFTGGGPPSAPGEATPETTTRQPPAAVSNSATPGGTTP